MTDSKEGGEQQKEKEKEKEKEEGKEIVHRKERSQNYKPRSIRLPPAADLEKAKAEYVDGVLIIIIPKDEEKARQRKVEVQ
ncbi:probable class I heat shock protein (Fragment) [Coccomyxa sp. Obi]